jgi:acyl carrier protein
MRTLQDRITSLLEEVCGVDATQVAAETRLDKLDLDSLSLIELSLAMQKEFDVELDDDQVADASTVGDLVTLATSAGATV